MNAFVYHQDILLTRLALLDIDGVARFEIPHLADAELQKVPCPQAIVDAECEKQEVARVTLEELFDCFDIPWISDWFNRDGRTNFRVVLRIPSHVDLPPVKVYSFKYRGHIGLFVKIGGVQKKAAYAKQQ